MASLHPRRIQPAREERSSIEKIITTALAVLAVALGAAACGGHSQSYQDGYQTGQDAATQLSLQGFACNTQTANLYDNSFDFPNDDPVQFAAGFVAGCSS